jgi:hypothetical protein
VWFQALRVPVPLGCVHPHIPQNIQFLQLWLLCSLDFILSKITLGLCCETMIGRADIEESKSNVAMNAWLPQASYTSYLTIEISERVVPHFFFGLFPLLLLGWLLDFLFSDIRILFQKRSHILCLSDALRPCKTLVLTLTRRLDKYSSIFDEY